MLLSPCIARCGRRGGCGERSAGSSRGAKQRREGNGDRPPLPRSPAIAPRTRLPGSTRGGYLLAPRAISFAIVTSIGGADVLALVADRPRVELGDRDLVVRAGESHAALYVLEQGRLSVEVQGRRIAIIDEVGAVVGELGLLLDRPASADVRSMGVATLRRVENADQLFAEVPDFARFVATTIAQRLYRVVGFLDDLQGQFADRPGTLGLVPQVLEQLLGASPEEINPGSDREPQGPY